MALFLWFLFISFCTALQTSYDISGIITIPDSYLKTFQTARIVLTGPLGKYATIPVMDNESTMWKFALKSVVPGTYLLDVHHHLMQFDQIRVDISSRDGFTSLFNVATQLPKSLSADNLIAIQPSALHNFYQTKEPFNLLAMILSPMGLMMLFGIGMVIIFPRIINSMDPEELEQLKKQQAEMNPMNMLNNWKQSLENDSNLLKQDKKKK